MNAKREKAALRLYIAQQVYLYELAMGRVTKLPYAGDGRRQSVNPAMGGGTYEDPFREVRA